MANTPGRSPAMPFGATIPARLALGGPLALGGVLALGAVLAGCQTIHVPRQATAEKQYDFALRRHVKIEQIILKDRDKVYPSIIKTYEAVGENFPDDKEYTPWAILKIGDIQLARGKYKKALAQYDKGRRRYADNEKIQAYVLLQMGRAYELTGRKSKARELYKECVDTFEEHPEKSVQEIVKQANRLYNRVIVE